MRHRSYPSTKNTDVNVQYSALTTCPKRIPKSIVRFDSQIEKIQLFVSQIKTSSFDGDIVSDPSKATLYENMHRTPERKKKVFPNHILSE
jgi:hypothetical protein